MNNSKQNFHPNTEPIRHELNYTECSKVSFGRNTVDTLDFQESNVFGTLPNTYNNTVVSLTNIQSSGNEIKITDGKSY